MKKWKISFVKILNNLMDVLKVELCGQITPDDAKIIIEDIKKVWSEQEYGRFLGISGKMPIWLYCIIASEFKNIYSSVMVFDPKIKGFVVVADHISSDIGKTVLLSDEELKKVI